MAEAFGIAGHIYVTARVCYLLVDHARRSPLQKHSVLRRSRRNKEVAHRSAGGWEVEILDVVKPEMNAVAQTADARKCITTGARSSLTTGRGFSAYAAGFGERPFFPAPAILRV